MKNASTYKATSCYGAERAVFIALMPLFELTIQPYPSRRFTAYACKLEIQTFTD